METLFFVGHASDPGRNLEMGDDGLSYVEARPFASLANDFLVDCY
jgi:hypothetical protein